MKNKLADLFRSQKFYFLFVTLAIMVVLPRILSGYIINQVLTLMIIFAVYASSWNLLAYSGQGSLGHAAFLGIGGFASALLAINLRLPPIIALFVGGIFSALVGLLVGLVCVRLKAWFLAMVTFGFAVIIETIFSQFDEIFSGIEGFPTTAALIAPKGIPFYYATLVLSTASIFSIYLIMKSKAGLAFKAMHENELEAKMIGINTAKYRLLAFVLSTFFAGLAGGLYAQSLENIQNGVFSSYNSFLPLIVCVIGGLGTIEGPILGSIIFVAFDSYSPRIDPLLNYLMGPLFSAVSDVGPSLRLIGLGLIFLVVVIFLPKGISSLIRKTYDYLRASPGK